MKANGYTEQSELLQGLMVVSQIRGFRIKKGEMKAALERSQEESLVKKRRVKKEITKKISKRTKIDDGDASDGSSSQESDDESAVEDDDGSMSADGS